MNFPYFVIKQENNKDVADLELLHTTGLYMLSKVYHTGKKDSKYNDALHSQDDKSKP